MPGTTSLSFMWRLTLKSTQIFTVTNSRTPAYKSTRVAGTRDTPRSIFGYARILTKRKRLNGIGRPTTPAQTSHGATGGSLQPLDGESLRRVGQALHFVSSEAPSCG